MASEVVTTITTLAGLQETVQAASAEFVITSRLFQACRVEQAINAHTVQFEVYPAPSPVSAGTEANAAAVTDAAISIASVTAAIAYYPCSTRVSYLSVLGGQRIPEHTRNIMVNNVASGVDKAIAAIATEANFTASVIESCVTSAKFTEAVYKLRNVGIPGQLKAFVTEYMAWKISQSDLGFFQPNTNDLLASQGYAGRTRIGGVDLFIIPSDWAPTSTTNAKKNGLMWVDNYGIGVGYHPGEGGNLLHTDIAKPDVFDSKIGVAAYMKPVKLLATGGIILESDSADE